MRQILITAALLVAACGPAVETPRIQQAQQTAFAGDVCSAGQKGGYGCTPDAGALLICGCDGNPQSACVQDGGEGGLRWSIHVNCSLKGATCGESDAGTSTSGTDTTCWTRLADGGYTG